MASCGIDESQQVGAAGHDDVPAVLLLQLADSTSDHVAVDDRRVLPVHLAQPLFDTTYFGIELIYLSAKPPSLGADGQNASQYLVRRTRPSSIAPASMVSSATL